MVELAQYAQVVDLLGLSDNKWARIIIGTSFSISNIIINPIV
ncbi:DUF2809 domain-containing protein [Nonlabens ulvanivorans]